MQNDVSKCKICHSHPLKQYKQKIEYVIIFIEKHAITFIQTTTPFSRNVLLQGSSVFQ